MSKLSPKSALQGISISWGGLSLTETKGYELVSLAVPQGSEKAFASAAKKALKTKLPAPSSFETYNEGIMIWQAPDQYWVLSHEDNIDADRTMAEKLKDRAYAVLLTDGWASLDLKGPKLNAAMERLTRLDVAAQPNGFAARTDIHHVAAVIIKHSDAHIQVLTPRSSSAGFVDAVTHVIDNIA